jgi:hypothetical protein
MSPFSGTVAVLSATLVVVMSGCSNQGPSPVGRWKTEPLDYPSGAQKPKFTAYICRDGTFKIDMGFGAMLGKWSMAKGLVHMTALQSLGKPLHGPEQVMNLKLSADQKTMMAIEARQKWTRESDTP